MSTELEYKRHTLAHLLAAAILKHYPDAKRTIGPAIEDGFYFDFDFPTAKPTEKDFEKLEKTMRELLPSWTSFERSELSAEDAKKEYPGNQFKHELIDEFTKDGQKVSFYKSGEYSDLCRGGHSENPSKDIAPDSFKLDRIAGAYWRGDEKNPMLTRIYGLAFDTKKGLDDYIALREEAKKRDHRVLGQQLKIFTFADEVGQGLPLWLPNGEVIRHELERWARETEEKWGYQHVSTPHITKGELFEISGHLPYYKDDLYSPFEIEGESYYLKPMNCPFSHMIYKSQQHSYRDMPVRYAEYGQVYRYERSGTLHGLMRVRGFCQNDAHIYVQPDQSVDEFVSVFKMHEYYYEKLGITDWWVVYGSRDPQNLRAKYHGDDAMWSEAEKLTQEALKKSGVKYEEEEGGAAHYGPKGDIYVRSVIGKAYAIGTVQLDLYMAPRFGLSYVDKDGKEKTPYIIHRAPLGSHERMIGFLLEHYAGAFPLWLSPVQVKVLPVSEKHNEYGQKVVRALKDAGLRAEIDDANESLGKKIRNAKTEKVPYIFVVGEKEESAGAVGVETRSGSEGAKPLDQMVERLKDEYKNRV